MEIIVGRDPSKCDIAVNDGAVSSVHARVFEMNGALYIVDENSSNGVFVNRRKIYDSHRIIPSDEIVIGNTQIVVSPDGKLSCYSINNAAKEPEYRNNAGTAYPDNNNTINHNKQYRIDRQLIIGRDAGCAIKIDHVGTSREHAKVYANNGYYYIEDLDSTNGTYINGQRIKGQQPLKNNDSIMISNIELLFKDGALMSNKMFAKPKNKNQKAAAISVNDLSKTYYNGVLKKNKKTVLNNISTQINVGEFVVILGTSGAGKSVFMSCLNGSEKVPPKSVTYANKAYADNEGFRQCIGAYVPQEDIIFGDLSVERCLYHSLKLKSNGLNYSESEMQDILNDVLSMVNLVEHKDKLVRVLSGGQRKRVSIAQEFLSDPDLIFLDEPTSGLDPGTEYSLMETFNKMAKEREKTVIMVTHDIANIDLCDRVIILGSGGYLCYSGEYDGIEKFFGVDRIGMIYPLIENVDGAKKWSSRFSAEASLH